jgi:hypothetical protein
MGLQDFRIVRRHNPRRHVPIAENGNGTRMAMKKMKRWQGESTAMPRLDGQPGSRKFIVYATKKSKALSKLQPYGVTEVIQLPPLEEEIQAPIIDRAPSRETQKG